MYDFKQLSPADFEDLTRDLLQKHWQMTLETFKAGQDCGIDLRYATDHDKALIVQCKHFVGSGVSKLVKHLEIDELPKVRRLNPKRYVLVTSVLLNPKDKEKIKVTLQPYVRNTEDIVGGNDLNNLLGKYPQIETQHFKLWMSSTAVLQRVLHNAERVHTNFNIDRVRRSIPLYVATQNYSRALEILDQRKFVIISGVPGIGKTTLADMLLFSHLETGYQPMVIQSRILEAREAFKDEQPQIFYFDDFLGETFLGNRLDFLGTKEDSAIIEFLDLIVRSKKSRMILTTREHVLQHAYQISERFKRYQAGLADHRCVLELSSYTLLDRGRILYNHIYFSDLPVNYKTVLLSDGFYMNILKHRNFNPRLVEWLSQFTNIKGFPIDTYRHEVTRVLDNPEQLWRIAFERQISEAARSVLLALYSLGGKAHRSRLETVWRALHAHRGRKYNFRAAPEDWRTSLQDLEGGFLRFEYTSAEFVNPSVKDFLDATLVSVPEHAEDLLASACAFEQIVTIWNLAKSSKGSLLQERLKQVQTNLVSAINSNLNNKGEEMIDGGRGLRWYEQHDVIPEIRLRTLLSIADISKSVLFLDQARSYTSEILTYWLEAGPDFEEGVGLLRALDSSHWARIKKSELHSQLKTALLIGLKDYSDSNNLWSIIDYFNPKDHRWTIEDKELLAERCAEYFDESFDEEFGNYNTVEELEKFDSRIEVIGNFAKINSAVYQDQVREAIHDLESRDDQEVGSVQAFESSKQAMPEYQQEIEVRRLFDGLRQAYK